MSESDHNGLNGSVGGGMDLDPAFASIPKNKSCLCVWRVEVCLLDLLDKNNHFYF